LRRRAHLVLVLLGPEAVGANLLDELPRQAQLRRLRDCWSSGSSSSSLKTT
jgi:hypothetical protein